MRYEQSKQSLEPTAVQSMRVYKVRPRKDNRGVNSIRQRYCLAVVTENKIMKQILIGLALLGLAGSGFGQEMKMVKVEDLVWKEDPVFKGAQIESWSGTR